MAERLAPAVVRRTVAVLLGTALSATFVAGSASAAGAPAPGARTATSSSLSAPDAAFRPTTTAHPGASGPTLQPMSGAPSDTTPLPAPDPSFRPAVSPPAYTPAAPVPPTAPRVLGPLGNGPRAGTSIEEHVVVRRGDTLWAIAARHLGPSATTAEIAHEWPRWHTANRAVIGQDADRIEPGQRLTPPAHGAAQ